MLSLPIYPIAEIDQPAQMFRCEFFKATLAAGICLARQKDTVSFARGGHAGRVTRARYEHCASGDCEQGNAIAVRLADFKPDSAQDGIDRKRAAFTERGQAKVAAIEKKLAALPAEAAPALPPTKPQDQFKAAKAATPAPPAKEKKMPRSAFADVTDDDIRKAFGDVGGNIKALATKFGSGWKSAREQVVRLGLEQAAPGSVAEIAKKHNGKKPRASRKPRAEPTPTTAAPPDSVVRLLQSERQKHVDQVARIDKALEALCG